MNFIFSKIYIFFIKKYKFPSAQTILIVLTVIVALLTWVIPVGQFD